MVWPPLSSDLNSIKSVYIKRPKKKFRNNLLPQRTEDDLKTNSGNIKIFFGIITRLINKSKSAIMIIDESSFCLVCLEHQRNILI